METQTQDQRDAARYRTLRRLFANSARVSDVRYEGEPKDGVLYLYSLELYKRVLLLDKNAQARPERAERDFDQFADAQASPAEGAA